MRLEFASFPVKDVRFGKQTSYNKGILEINKEELVSLVAEDNKITSVDLDVAFPGDQTRIVRVRDVIEPRVKTSGPGCVFPGIWGPVETAGEGRTHRLSGVTVIPAVEYRPTIMHGITAQIEGMVDMWGPGAQMSPYGSTINIVPTFKLIDNIAEWDAHTAIQSAMFKVANRLAETTRDKTPETEEVFELSKVDPSLPRVVYIRSVLTSPTGPHAYVAFYGWPLRESLPTLVHPNEFLDGAVTTDARQGGGTRTQTWVWMNQPVVLALLREHGKRLNFMGVILQRTFFEEELGKRVSAAATSQMARLLGADGAIISQTSPSGANFMDVMFTVQACEKKGLKTVLLTPEWGGKEGTEVPLMMYVPEATAMVSTGSHERDFKVPAPAKIIGGKHSPLFQRYTEEMIDPKSEFTAAPFDYAGGIDYFGNMNLACKEY